MADKPGRPRTRTSQDVDTAGQEWGSDYIVDLLRAYGFKYIPFNPGASFRGIEESIVNYAQNHPEVIQTPNEGVTVAIAHGHAKATGDPAVCLLHNAVGTLNGAMGVFNAFVDRVPIVILGGNGPVRKRHRRPWIDWIHSTLDQGTLVREFTKWDDQPAHSDGVAESVIRAHNIAATRPFGPTYVTLDHDVQENTLSEPLPLPDLDRYQPPRGQAPDQASIDAAADHLIAAEMPVVITSLVGDSREAVSALVTLTERLAMPVVNMADARYNYPTTHPYYLPEAGVLERADVILALDARSLNRKLQTVDRVTHERTDRIRDDATLIDISTHDVDASSLIATYYSIRETDLSILADTAHALPMLDGAVQDALDGNKTANARVEERAEWLEDQAATQRAQWDAQTEDAWDETPISIPRLASELWDLIRDEEWVLVNGTLRQWTHRIWEIDEFDQYIGGYAGGAGVGYGIGAAIGGALAYEETDRIPINLQADGDLMQYAAGLWTMAHHDIPMLSIVHNNESLYNSTEHRMNLAGYRGRDDSYESALIGTGLWDPVPDYATVADGFGVNGYGPIDDPDELASALDTALADVKNGEPALVDVIAQPR